MRRIEPKSHGHKCPQETRAHMTPNGTCTNEPTRRQQHVNIIDYDVFFWTMSEKTRLGHEQHMNIIDCDFVC